MATLPLRSRSLEIRDWEPMKRWASSISDISREKRATGLLCFMATFWAKSQTRVDFPMAGLAAITIRLPGWKPPVLSSRSRKPEGGAGDLGVAAGELLELVDLVVEDVADLAEVVGLLLVRDLEEQPLGVLDQGPRLAVALRDRLLDLLGGALEAPHQRVLLDDLRVVLGAARRGDLGGEAGDDVAAADSSSWPRWESASETVRTSTGSAFSWRRMIAS